MGFLNKLVMLFFLLLFLFSSVYALNVNLSGTYNVCQCETAREKISVCAQQPGNYLVRVDGSVSKWFSLAPSQISLNANECRDIFLFVTPECYADSGSYNNRLIISGPEDYNGRVTVNVRQCHSLLFDVSPKLNSSKPCEESVFAVLLKNTGSFRDEFVFTQFGLNPSWVSYPQEKFVLNPSEEMRAQIKFKSPCNAVPKDYNFNFSVSNTKVNVSGSASLVQKIIKYIPFEFDGFFDSLNNIRKGCEEFDGNFTYTITNKQSKQDELTISLLDKNFNKLSKDIAFFDQEKIVLDANSSKTISLIIKKNSPKTVPAVLRVYSKNYDFAFETGVDFVFENCYDVSVARVSQENVSCLGALEQKFLVKNNGTQKADVNVSFSDNNSVIETKSLALESSASKEIVFSLKPAVLGAHTFSVLAKIGFLAENGLSYNYSFENCYDVDFSINDAGVCETADLNQIATIKNNGTRDVVLNLVSPISWLNPVQRNVTVESGKQVSVSFVGKVPQGFDSNYFKISAQSPQVSVSKNIRIYRLSDASCNDLSFSGVPDLVDVNCCAGKIISLEVKNAGYFSQKINLRKVFPDWVTVSENSVTLAKGESKIVYVYFSPPAGTNGKIQGKINLSNDRNVSKDVLFNLNVFGGNCGLFNADVNIGNKVIDTNVITRKEVTVEVVLTNDSNLGFNVNNVLIRDSNSMKDLNVVVDFNKGTFLAPKESLTVSVTAKFAEGEEPVDKNVVMVISTSAGEFTKTQLINFSEKAQENVSITGWFSAFAMPIVGILVVILLVLIILALISSGKKEKEREEENEKPVAKEVKAKKK
jgi:uncharacterized membrane protein